MLSRLQGAQEERGQLEALVVTWGGPVVQPWWAPCQITAASSPQVPLPIPLQLGLQLPPLPNASTFQLPSHQLHPGLASKGTATKTSKVSHPQQPSI